MKWLGARWVGAVAVACVVAGAWVPTVRAQEVCPEKTPEDPLVRRTDAKKFFDIAQASQAAGRNNEALKQYVCSFKMVRHPFTAYNLAKLAEKTGDLELAKSSYKAYLELAPDADDRDQVKREIEALQERIDELNRDQNIQMLESNQTNPKNTGVVTPVTPVTTPPGVVEHASPSPSDDGSSRRLAGWISLGVAGGALAGGIAFNLMARSKMDTCNQLWDDPDKMIHAQAVSACDAARPRAYLSYVGFGVSVVAAATGALLLWWNTGGEGASHADRSTNGPQLGFVPLGGGGLVTIGGSLPGAR